MQRMKRVFCVLIAVMALVHAHGAGLTDAELAKIGRKVWVNECDGSIAGLTSWNEGEAFASLGIGHFIWYPGRPGPFEESFPQMVQFLEAHGVTAPAWVHGRCPWLTREQFEAAQSSGQMNELRTLLAGTIPLQTRFLVMRMQLSLPKMLAAGEPGEKTKVQANFNRLLATGGGTFELIDYVNFKGEGTLPTERYNGQGWGLLQVLETMPAEGDPVAGFSKAAKSVLARRVHNAPPERHEEKWLLGWDARVERYTE
jgi:hypothetical protein